MGKQHTECTLCGKTIVDRKERYLETIPETIRVILSEYVRRKLHPNDKGDKKG
jgi:hypothetical protein